MLSSPEKKGTFTFHQGSTNISSAYNNLELVHL
jgi:hypothetical protein